jgi:hypothetical protein
VTLHRITQLLDAEVLWNDRALDLDITVAKASDLMSDVLIFSGPGKLLITGLTNMHTIRTCDIAGIQAIIFVRGKRPSTQTIEMAKRYGIALFATQRSMFDACGILYANGLQGVRIKATQV